MLCIVCHGDTHGKNFLEGRGNLIDLAKYLSLGENRLEVIPQVATSDYHTEDDDAWVVAHINQRDL